MAGQLRQPINTAALEAFLDKELPSVNLPIELKEFGYGHSNPTYQIIDARGNKFVLRKKPPGKILSKSAHQVEREFRMIKALENTDVPVPKAFLLCEDPGVIGTAFYIMEFLDGRIFADPHIPGVSQMEREAIWHDVVRTLRRIHDTDFKSIGLGDLQRTGEFYTRQINTFGNISRAQAAAVDVETGEPVGNIPHLPELEHFFKSQQPRDRITIVHGDYKIDNMIFHKTEPKVIGVLDWELTTLGHPLSDFANLTAPFPFGGAEEGVPKPVEFRPGVTPGLPSLKQCIEWYRESGYDVSEDLAWGRAFAAFRACVNLQGIAARYALRQASSPEAREVAMRLQPQSKILWEIVQRLRAHSRPKAKV